MTEEDLDISWLRQAKRKLDELTTEAQWAEIAHSKAIEAERKAAVANGQAKRLVREAKMELLAVLGIEVDDE